MNLTQLIIKQASIFPSCSKDQLKRLCKAYNGSINDYKFKLELNYLVKKNIIRVVKGKYTGLKGYTSR